MASRCIRCTVSYDGTEFAGSQIQPQARTVAGTLKTGLETILDQEVHLVFAGRTDSGVHADGNVCSFEADLKLPVAKLAEVLNNVLPRDLRVRDTREAASSFHPRFDAISRCYVYRLYRSGYVPVDRRRYVTQYQGPWDRELLDPALMLLAGRYSFVNYCKEPVEADDCLCELTAVKLRELAGGETELWFTGNRFLRHMICRLTGALLEVAANRVTGDQFAQSLCGTMEFKPKPAPPGGLTLVRVDYPEED